ncbi:hypothetical protein [Compostimonas suwonensis]|uniref:Uncharacterized protein n=1 Tax=Compostimonas suwonensis TaxID=1048394 RepID=A0A2M9C4S9_9MICO|nr:hypothetical protein [Compostimonas suwonensis]PJJ65533.1 hypothetical protein CLV54_0566 [Compostimonas suwonensis]
MAAAAGATGVALAMTSCIGLPRAACPAIGWLNTATVVVEDAGHLVSRLEFCIDEACHSAQGPEETVRGATGGPTTTGAPGAHAGDDADAATGPGAQADSGAQADPDEQADPDAPAAGSTRVWTLDLMMTAPDEVLVWALDAGGDILHEQSFALDWARVGGSEECGGPARADPLFLTVG